MLNIALILMLPATAVEADQQDPATQVQAAQPEKPKIVCTMEPVTGARAKEQQVCKTPGYEKGVERSKEMFRQIQGGSGNVQPTLPKGVGG